MKNPIKLLAPLRAFILKFFCKPIAEPLYSTYMEEGILYLLFKYTGSTSALLRQSLSKLGIKTSKDLSYLEHIKNADGSVSAIVKIAIIKGGNKTTAEVYIDSQVKSFVPFEYGSRMFFKNSSVAKCLTKVGFSSILALHGYQDTLSDVTVYEFSGDPFDMEEGEDPTIKWASTIGFVFLVPAKL